MKTSNDHPGGMPLERAASSPRTVSATARVDERKPGEAVISIIMPIYNCEKTLEEAILSIVHQTVTDWELLLCADPCKDDTWAVAEAWAAKEPRIKLIKNEEHLGNNASMNRAIRAAKGEYFARQDADDISLPDRFERQLACLQADPGLALVATGMTLFDEEGDWGVSIRTQYPDKNEFMRGAPFAHATVMMHREPMLQVGGYGEGEHLLRVEDYHLWYKLYKAGYRGMNMPDLLYRCRDDRDAQARRSWKNRINEARLKWRILRDFRPSVTTWPLVLRPLVVGMLPASLYRRLHRNKLGGQHPSGAQADK